MRRAGGIAAVLILLAGAFLLGLFLTRSSELLPPPSAAGPQSRERLTLPIEEVRGELARSYYRSIGPSVLDEPTIAEILEALDDPNTDYMTAAEYELLKNRTAKSYLGVGLTVETAQAGLLVTSALRGPAREAGIKRGDIIVGIDGQAATKLSFEQSLALIKGERGTFVRLTVKRARRETIQFRVMRRVIAVPSLRARLLSVGGTKVAYARLLSFREGSAQALRDAAQRLVARGAQGMILDVRDNPGGLLAQAVRTVSIFLDEGVVCSTAGLHEEEMVYEVSGTATYTDLPLVVLVNGGSASAAEIVAAALQDHRRAIVVGRHTFGKASVQSIRPLSNGTALKLTTATYRTPAGVDLAERGVLPTVKALDDPLTRPDEALRKAARVLLKQVA